MSSGAKQLVEDFEQVQKLLESYPNIKIINTKGDPPEQYDIEYTIKGYKTNPDGSASPENKHEVSINLPFGYPHFPPTAKPITPIFHPDIDPDAIRIADFWEENNSLPELIIHIGQMICGNHYTKEEPFNQSALEWFQERESWLPFDILEPKDDEEISEETETDGATTAPSGDETKKTFVPATDLDILKDDIDFPFDDEEESLGIEDEFSFDIDEDIEEFKGFTEELADEVSIDLGDKPADEVNIDFGDEPEDEMNIDFGDEPEDEINIDLGDDSSVDLTDLQDSKDEIGEDILSLEAEEISDDFSFDLDDLDEETQPEIESPELGELLDLETTSPAVEPEDASPLEFDAEDISPVFDEESGNALEESESIDISLDDLAGLEDTEDSLDLDEEEESIDIGDEATIDLSGLEQEEITEKSGQIAQSPDASAGEEDKILSALSLDEDFASEGKIADQSQAIGSLIEQKHIYAAKKVLADFPDPDLLPEKAVHEQAIANAISEAEELYKKANNHEKKGDFEKAGILLDLVANIAIDFPGLELARNRIRDSIMGGDKVKSYIAVDKIEVKEKEVDTITSKEKEPVKKTKPKKKIKVPVRLIVILVIVLLLAGIGAGAAYVYTNDSKHIDLAQTGYQKGEQLVKKKEFKKAQKEFEAAQSNLEKVLFFQGGEKESIQQHISSITDSSVYREGLKGRVLYGDKYVSVETAKAIDKFNIQKSNAEKVLESGNLAQAISAYEKSLPYAEEAGFDREYQVISRKIAELRLQLALANAKESEEKQDWLGAKNSFQEALELGENITEPQDLDYIANQLASASYRYGLHESLKAIEASEWQRSITALQEVNKILEAHPKIVNDAQKTEIDKLLIQSHLYFYLAEAKEAFESKAWTKAIDTYSDAISLLSNNIDLLGEAATENISKIKKTILTTRIAKEQAEIEKTKASNELQKKITHYEAIAELIRNSTFQDDETLAKILEDAQSKTIELKNQLLISEREKWLTDNFDSIFRDNYPSARSSELTNPQVRFVKREDNIMIFNISCTERKQGRKFRLELNYQNNLNNNAWSIYSGKIAEGE